MGRTMNEIKMEQEIIRLKARIESQERRIKDLSAGKDFWREAYEKTNDQLREMFKMVKSYQEKEERLLLEK